MFRKPPRTFDEDAACLIGLNESIILQQIYYWCEVNREANRNFQEGHFWTYNSYSGWQKQFKFWSLKTIKRIITNLERKGLIISGNFNAMKMDRTKWYRVNYEAVESLELVSGIGRVNMTSASGQNDPMGEEADFSEASEDYMPESEIGLLASVRPN